MEAYQSRTCGECSHFEERGVDPMNLGSGRMGECRQGLHVLAIPVMVEDRLGMKKTSVQISSIYAQVPAEFKACAHFFPRPLLELP